MSSVCKVACSHISQRWLTVVLGFFGLLNAYAMRVCLSIAITQMVSTTETSSDHANNQSDQICPHSGSTSADLKNTTISTDKVLYDWSEYTQGMILSSFYCGYLPVNLFGGILAERFGGKYTLGLGILSTAVFTLLTPLGVSLGGPAGGAGGLIALRIFMGAGEGTTFPALSALLARWIPEHERSKAGALAYAGAPLGTVFGTLGSGLILRYSSWGWPAVFYFFGAAGVLSFVALCLFCYSSPRENPFISEAEASYLEQNLKVSGKKRGSGRSAPWGHILRSGPVWALILITVGFAWSFYMLVSDMPKYMSQVLRFDVESNGYMSSLPYVCMWLLSWLGSWASDAAVNSGWLSAIAVRKIGVSLSSSVASLLVLAASYAGCNSRLVVGLLSAGAALMGFFHCSAMVGPQDLAPNYAGSIMGLVNCFATLSGILCPYVVGLLTPDQSVSQWRSAFWIAAVVPCVGNLAYLILGSASLQPWNDLDADNDEATVSELQQPLEGRGALPVKLAAEVALAERRRSSFGFGPEATQLLNVE
ncbi:hypothetical protein QAD02_017199 [Eretmocerus hayati]|uniref:Uncharacterized protein n=1 Tax=Eretmocerus hayati TaxID=131215 RepID=A0ACC2PDL9_9HYME|nr:hypothetical protein QAD02_017199 [Eretmocerus hayati]